MARNMTRKVELSLRQIKTLNGMLLHRIVLNSDNYNRAKDKSIRIKEDARINQLQKIRKILLQNMNPLR